MKSKFYSFKQNNSGGSFKTNAKLCHRLIIEAKSQDEAGKKAFAMGVYYDGVREGLDCGCCGDRWYPPEEMVFPLRYGTFEMITARTIAKKYGADFKKTTWKYLGSHDPDPDKYDVMFKNPRQYLKYMVTDGIRWNKKVEGRIFYLSGKVFEI